MNEIREFKYKYNSHIVHVHTNMYDINELYIDNELVCSDSFPSNIKILTADISLEKSITAVIRTIDKKPICFCIVGRPLNAEPTETADIENTQKQPV